MPVCLCDGDVYIIENHEEFDRRWALSFFLNGHVQDYLLLYDKGIITYSSLLLSQDIESAIISEKLYIGDDNFWEKARSLLQNERECIPVLDRNGDIVYFAKRDETQTDADQKLCALRDYVEKQMWEEFPSHEERLHIEGMTDVLFQLRKWLISLGVDVSVSGEGWEFFGIEKKIYENKDITVIRNDYEWIDVIYDEYCSWIENYSVKMKELLCTSYTPKTERRVIFYLSPYSYFIESIMPLMLYYLQSEIECVFVLDVRWFMTEGVRKIDNIVRVIKRLNESGGRCYDVSCLTELCKNYYFICYMCSDYSDDLPVELRKRTRYVVALQTTGIYTHMYLIKGRLEEVFSEAAREKIDYLIASEYVADWVCKYNEKWDEKLLRFGYPKLDALYNALKSEQVIPDEWRDKIAGKRVYLFLTQLEQSWLDFFAREADHAVAIWRPHPLSLLTVRSRERIMSICENNNIILDDLPSYYVSFQISDALIAAVNSSVMINYLYTGKPICLYGQEEVYQMAVMDYRQEVWYKSVNNALSEERVIEFIESIERGETLMDEEKKRYRNYVTSNFDGHVCERIYNFFIETEYKKEDHNYK